MRNQRIRWAMAGATVCTTLGLTVSPPVAAAPRTASNSPASTNVSQVMPSILAEDCTQFLNTLSYGSIYYGASVPHRIN